MILGMKMLEKYLRILGQLQLVISAVLQKRWKILVVDLDDLLVLHPSIAGLLLDDVDRLLSPDLTATILGPGHVDSSGDLLQDTDGVTRDVPDRSLILAERNEHLER